MCGKIAKDVKGSVLFGDEVLGRVIRGKSSDLLATVNNGGGFKESMLGDELTARITYGDSPWGPYAQYFNARIETLLEKWLDKGAVFFRPNERIASYFEKRHLEVVPDGKEVLTIASPYNQRMEFKVVTTEPYDDGYAKIHRRWPFYVPCLEESC
jgi:hypothetical protein